MCLMFSLTFYNTERIDKRQYLLIKNEDRQTTDKRTDIQTFNQVFFLSLLVILLRFFTLRILRTLFLFFFVFFYSFFTKGSFVSSFSPSFCHVLSSKESSSHSFSPSRTYYTRSLYLFLSLSFTLLLSLSLSFSLRSTIFVRETAARRKSNVLTSPKDSPACTNVSLAETGRRIRETSRVPNVKRLLTSSSRRDHRRDLNLSPIHTPATLLSKPAAPK